MESPDQIESKRVERPDPHRRGRISVFLRNPLGHFASGFVREGEEKNTTRVGMVIQKSLRPCRQCLGLPCSRPSLKQVSFASMLCGGFLFGVESVLGLSRLWRDNNWREQKGVKQLLSYDLERRAKPFRNGGRALIVLNMKLPNHRTRQ